MVMLKDLTLTVPSLTPAVLSFLAGQQILTVEDFIVQDEYGLVVEAGRSMDSSEFVKAARALLSYMTNFHEGWSLGSELLDDIGQFLPTSCASLDSILGGGLLEGTITEISGKSGTGKSQICFQAAASVVHRMHAGVIYVDTGVTFSAKRIANILGSFMRRSQQSSMDKYDAFVSGMKSVWRIPVLNIFEMLSYLCSLHDSLRSNFEAGDAYPGVRLLIIDSVAAAIIPVLGGSNNNSRGHALMMSLARRLYELAAVHKIAVLIINHAVEGDTGLRQPALGESWISVPHSRLWLSRDAYNGVCEASLVKHASLACNKKAAFTITKGGLRSLKGGGK